MADKTIGELPAASEVFDDSLLVMEQQGEARSVRGELVKKYAVAAVQVQADAAKGYADDAKKSQDAAAESAKDAADVALHPPILKAGTDHWWTWSTEANDYVESEYDAGVSIEVLPDVISVGPDEPARVENLGTPTDPRYQFYLKQGDPGADGVDGFSPTVEVTKVGKDTTITITDAEGEHVATVRDGEAAIPDHLIVGDDSELGATMPVNADTLDSHNADYFASKTEMNTGLGKKQDVLPYYSNPNLLDNWYFVGGGSQQGGGQFPINQRVLTEYSGIRNYSIDRWLVYGSNLVIEDQCISITDASSSGGGAFGQAIEDSYDIFGKTVTLSVLLDDGTLITGTNVAPLKDSGEYYTVYFNTLDENNTIITLQILGGHVNTNILPATGKTIKIKAAKLELGDQQTLAHQENGEWVLNDPPPNYQQELAKCQRYQRFLGYQILNGFFNVAGSSIFLSFFHAEMRILPTLSNYTFSYGVCNGSLLTLNETTIDTVSFAGRGSDYYLMINMKEPMPQCSRCSCGVYTTGGLLDANL